MTQLDVMYRYGVPPSEGAMMAVGRISEVYGIRGLVFDEAARQLRWHYQWIVLNEFLPTLVGTTFAAQVLREGPRYFAPFQTRSYHLNLPMRRTGTATLRFVTATT